MNIESICGRIERDLKSLHQYTSTPGNGTTRLPFTQEIKAAGEHIKRIMEEAGFEVHTDNAGNIIGRLPGENSSLPAIATGSHMDTVLSGGNFDGQSGLIVGIELARMAADMDVKLKRDLIVVAFNDEEGVRFGTGYFGSRCIAGQVTVEELKKSIGRDGVSAYEAMKAFGLDPDNIASAAWDMSKIAAFIEMHIEQGPVLHQKGIEIGLVECIVGMERYAITVHGRPDHAGTTPMDMRHDAMEAATRVISKIPGWAREQGGGTVGTTGFMTVKPGGMNIVAEEVVFSVDVRSAGDDLVDNVIANIMAELEAACKDTDCTYEVDKKMDLNSVYLSKEMTAVLEKSCRKHGFTSLRMNSGAGHDAEIFGEYIPTAMVFVPSKDGRSHCAVESTEYIDIAKAALVVFDLLTELQ